MTRIPSIGVLAVVFLLAGGVSARAADKSEVLSPVVKEALDGLSAEDYGVREKALQQLEVALGRQLQAMVSLDDPESQTRLSALLEFNEGLTHWAIDTLKLPDEQRKTQLKWGLAPEMVATVAKAYSSNADRRLEAAKELAKLEGEEPASLVAHLLNDPERVVSVAAMEAVWDRKPNDQIIDALWQRAVEAGMTMYAPRMIVGGPNIVFRGQVVANNNNFVYDNNYLRVMQDNGIATDVLIHLKAPQVTEKLKALFIKAETDMTKANNRNPAWMYMAQNEPMRNAYRLVEAYKPVELVPIFFRIIDAKVLTKSQGQMGAEKYFWSNRTAPLAALLVLTDQKPEEYKLKKMAALGNLWCVPTEAAENAAVEKLKEWWTKNAQKYGVTLPAAEGAPTTEPAASQPGAGAISE